MARNLMRGLLVLLIFLLLAVQGVAAAPVNVTSQQAHNALKQVLSRGEFGIYTGSKADVKLKESARSRWLEQKLREMGKAIENFFRGIWRALERLFPERKTSDKPGFFSRLAHWFAIFWAKYRYPILIGLAVALLAIIGWLVSHLYSQRQKRETESAGWLDDLVADPDARRKQEPSFWDRSLEQAELLWQQGQQREALRVLTRACLVLLDARGVLRYDESRANGEVLRELRRHGRTGVQQSLKPIVRSFDRSWYGYLPVTDDEFAHALDDSRRFRSAVVEAPNA